MVLHLWCSVNSGSIEKMRLELEPCLEDILDRVGVCCRSIAIANMSSSNPGETYCPPHSECWRGGIGIGLVRRSLMWRSVRGEDDAGQEVVICAGEA